VPDSYVPGLPGIRSAKTATHRIVFKQGDWLSDLALGKIIDGSKSRDPGNTGDLDVLRPGILMGKISASGKYAPALLGVTNGALSASATSITVAAAVVTELVRRIGSSGTFTLLGPPSANGTVASETVTYSAASGTTITCTAISNAYVTGSFIGGTDGSQTALTLVPDGYGIKCTDVDGTTNLDVQFPQFPIAGVITSTQLLPVWPTDTSLQAQIVKWLNAASGGQFVFDHGY
jgi:hypothetical protein